MVQSKQSFLKGFLQNKGQTKSYILMLCACLFWVTGYIYGNQHKFSPIETNLSRSIVMVVGMYIICKKLDLNIQYKKPKSWKVLLKRHFAFVLQGFVLAGVQFYIPLGITHTIASTGPIIILALQAFVFKNGTITGKKLQGCILGVVGILLISNGKIIYSYIDDTFQFRSDFGNYVQSSYLVMIGAIVILLLAMIIWAYGVLITQQAQCHSFEIIFHFAVTNLFISSIFYLLQPDKRPAQQIYHSLLWTGVVLLLSQICFTLSLNLSQNIGLTNIASFGVVAIGYGISIFRYGETVQFVSIVGTVLVIAGVSFVILTKQDSVETKQIQLNQKFTKQEIEL